MENKSVWLGQDFWASLPSATWKEVSGIYIFCGVTPQNVWNPLYVGQADNLRTRLANHERWREALALGASHILAKEVPLQADRDQLEQALIRSSPSPAEYSASFPGSATLRTHCSMAATLKL